MPTNQYQYDTQLSSMNCSMYGLGGVRTSAQSVAVVTLTQFVQRSHHTTHSHTLITMVGAAQSNETNQPLASEHRRTASKRSHVHMYYVYQVNIV